uniref:EGF-like domain-containing protein n=1 Tax=Ciona savignyi TaxID=51511 RepID=H2Y641_CIOSA
MKLNLFVILFCLTPAFCHEVSTESICALNSCTTPSPLFSSIVKLCEESKGLSMRGRCCVQLSDNSIIVGVDLSFCNISSIGRMLTIQAPKLQHVNLTNNPLLTISDETFRGLHNLTTLSLPPSVSCPGNHSWFNSSWQPWNKVVQHRNTIICSNQTDTCGKLHSQNYTCPEHSTCHNDGPGLFDCACHKGWGGYKCLRMTGGIPTVPIVCGSFGSSIVISALVWWTQRRHVIS